MRSQVRTHLSKIIYPVAAVLAFLLAPASANAQKLLTVAERSDYKETSVNAQVIEYCQELAKLSPLVRLAEMGTSGEGKKLQMVILADPPIASAEEAKKSGKMVLFAMGNIHAGEVDGKEGIMMLMRDLALAKDRPLLKNFILVFLPNFNPDGGDRISLKNRTKQNGPPAVGTRENAKGFDLNRDYVKAETPEVKALIKFFNEWDPALVIDTHTTDGLFHAFTITYDGPRHPASDAKLIEYSRDTMLPELGKMLEKMNGYKANYYGNFTQGKTAWDPNYPAVPRFGTQYLALRNRLGILSESYVYASYKDRVLASRDFVLANFEYVAKHKGEIAKLLKDAEANSSRPKVALRHKIMPFGKEITILSLDGKVSPPAKVKEFVVTYLGRCEPTVSVTRPYAYLVPDSFPKAIETLKLHGIKVGSLTEDSKVPVEIYKVDKMVKSARPFQQHNEMTLEVTPRTETQTIKAGTAVVYTDQPLGTLAAFILEPQSEDGLGTWNYFDAGLKQGGDYPVLRVPAEVKLATK
jgi:hypothetical protein